VARRRRNDIFGFELSEVTVHFSNSDASSKQALAAAKRLGLDLDLTPRQLDALRGHTDELRSWLRNRPERHEAFVRNPAAVLDTVAGTEQRPRSSRRRPGTLPRWRGVGRSADIAAAGAEMYHWALAEPGRLAKFLKDPASVIDAALPGHSPASRKRVAAALTPPPKRPNEARPGRTKH
jgi:hypothetical protein